MVFSVDAKTRKKVDIKFVVPPGHVPAAGTVTLDFHDSGKMWIVGAEADLRCKD